MGIGRSLPPPSSLPVAHEEGGAGAADHDGALRGRIYNSSATSPPHGVASDDAWGAKVPRSKLASRDDTTFDTVSRAAIQCMRVSEELRQASKGGDLGTGVAETLRDVGLTLATLDRSLFGFIDKILTDAGLAPLYASSTGTIPDLADAVRTMNSLPRDVTNRIPRGGVVSLLHHFYSVLDSTREAVARLNRSRRPQWGATVLSVLACVAPMMAATVVSRSAFARSLRGLRRRLLSGGAGALVLWAILRVKYVTSAHHALRVSHSQLQLLLRIWLICLDVFTAANIKRDTSYATLVGRATADDYDDARKPAARLLLEQMSLPRGSAVWFRNSYRMMGLKYFLDVLYSSQHVGYRLSKSSTWSWLAWPASLAAAGFYAGQPGRASDRAADLMQSTAMRDDCSFVARVWGLLDSPPVRLASSLLLPNIEINREVRIENVKCHVFFRSKLPGSFFSSRMLHFRRAPRSGLDGSPADGDPSSASESGAASFTEESIVDLARTCSVAPFIDAGAAGAPPCLLYIHGGGFVGTSFASDAQLLVRWARKSNVLIVFVHYALSPEHRFPTALEECLRVYCWLRLHSRRVAVFGESAGGNLAAALVLRCLEEEVPVPDGLVLCYPALNLNSSPSPSRALHLGDPLIPISLLIGLANAYVPRDLVNKPIYDPLLCPGLATDAQLRQFPPTYIAAGGCDPLLDDAIDFNTRLRRVGVAGAMRVYRGLPHGFIAFRWLMEEAGRAVEYCRRCLGAVLLDDTGAGGDEPPAPLPVVAPVQGGAAGEMPSGMVSPRRRRGSVGRGTPANGRARGRVSSSGSCSPSTELQPAGELPSPELPQFGPREES